MSQDRYFILVKTDKALDPDFGAQLLAAWIEELPRVLWIERFDGGEPVKRDLVREGAAAAIGLWAELGTPIMLARKSPPRILVDMSWRANRGADRRPYPWSCSTWLDRRAGDELAIALFRFVVLKFEASFGLLTTESDLRRKHWFVFAESTGGTVEAMRGLDVYRELPGIYWLTYFGRGAINLLGTSREVLASRPDAATLGDGVLLRPFGDSRIIGTSEAMALECQVRSDLGASRFFSRSSIASAEQLLEPPAGFAVN